MTSMKRNWIIIMSGMNKYDSKLRPYKSKVIPSSCLLAKIPLQYLKRRRMEKITTILISSFTFGFAYLN